MKRALLVLRVPLCMRHDTCAELLRRTAPAKEPFIFVARIPGTSAGFTDVRSFTVRVPREIRVGRYKVFVW